MITNRIVGADEAVELGMANRAYPAEIFAETAAGIARDLAAAPANFQAIAKDSFHPGWRRSIEEATEYEIQNGMTSVRDPIFHTALKRFLEDGGKSSKVRVDLP